MSNSIKKVGLHLDRPNIVGTFHADKKTETIEIGRISGIDAVEFRLDLLGRLPSSEALTTYHKALIMTARHAEEGGNRTLNHTERIKLLSEAIPLADFVDLELRFWNEVSPIVQLARESNVGIIASFHDFSGTPTFSELLEKVRLARQFGADVFKVATHLNSPSDLAHLLQLLEKPLMPVAAMGMGSLGAVSRLALACCGSVLNYCWLGSPLVAGQWSAEKFSERLKEIIL